MTLPKNWRDCAAFVRDLDSRAYLVDGKPCMSDGIYLYMYELWRDGRREGRESVRRSLRNALKVQHVQDELTKGTKQQHMCHWPGCERRVPPAVWGCQQHWYKLPKELRGRIWNAYRVGQEVDKRPSKEYLRVSRDVERWISDHSSMR